MSRPTVYSARAARQLDTVAVEVARAEAERGRAEANAAAQAARLRSERERQATLAELRAIAEAERERRTARRRREQAARWAARRQALSRHGVLLATVAVIALSVAVALPAQISFLAERWPMPMALAGGVALEALTWVFALQGRARAARGLSEGVHHAGIWCAAGAAAGVNLTHGAQLWGPGFAVVAAFGSMAAPITWHMYLLSQHTGAPDPEQARQARRRRRHHRKVARVAERLATALPSELSGDQAWCLAWRAVHGAELGITAKLLETHSKAASEVAQHLLPGDRASLALLERPVVARPAARPTDVRVAVEAGFAAARPVVELLRDSVYTPAQVQPGGGRTGAYSLATGHMPVRTAATRAVRTGPVQPLADGAEIEAKRRAARTEIRRTIATGGTPSPTDIGRTHGMSPEWGAKQIRAVRSEQHPAPAADTTA